MFIKYTLIETSTMVEHNKTMKNLYEKTNHWKWRFSKNEIGNKFYTQQSEYATDARGFVKIK